MKRYLFLKLGLTILVFTAASPRSQVPENFSSNRENRRYSNNQNVEQSTIPSSQKGDNTNTNVPDYQGVMGKPGVDFPVLKFIPRTKFTCRGKKSGYYADLETNCQVFHICDEGRKVSFLCPNGTIFQQSDLICDWWFKVDCAISPTLYDESAEQLHEDNLRRKENRKVQHIERRKQHINNNNNNTPKQKEINRVEYTKQRKQNAQNNYVKKDINQFTSNNDYNSNINNNNKETQILSETASFVSNRYTSENQHKYLKNLNLNDVVTDTQTYVPPKSYITGNVTPLKTSTEKITNRGSRTFNNKNQYKNQISDQIKTTTQHTIYSPTVPPFTASSKYTTKIPAPFSTTTESYKLNTRSKNYNGFYITKDLTTEVPSTHKVFTNPRQVYTPSTFIASTLINTAETLHTTPAIVSKNLVGSDVITRSKHFHSNDNIDTTTTEIINTESFRNAKQIEFTTMIPVESTPVKNTIMPSVPTPFRTKEETLKDSSSTHKFNEFTYLPKSTELPTPKPTIPTEYTTFSTDPTVTDNLHNMIKTLEEIEGENPLLDEEKSNSRPGLHIPPSAGPKTLHSLAIYFATALDNLVTSNNETIDNSTEKYETTSDDTHVTLLSRMTQDKYNSLFDDNSTDYENKTLDNKEYYQTTNVDDLTSYVEHDAHNNDLDGQQSRGPVSSSTPRIRQLAQVFTQALSAYLDDPDTFKKVLEEIRPTEPPLVSEDVTEIDANSATTIPTSITTEYKSYTKEEDEVLDFSDADKSSTYKPFIENNIRTTQSSYIQSSPIVTTTSNQYLNEISTQLPLEKENKINATLNLSKRIPTPNPLALDLNNGLKLSTPQQDIDGESSVEENTESDDYFPFNTGEDEEDTKRRATAKPYGLGVKPENSTPISIPATDSLLPPFKVSLLHKSEEFNSSFLQNDEYLQSAHSQSFISHNSNNQRDGKSIVFNSTEISLTTTTTNYYKDTTIYTTPFDYYTSTSQPTTYNNEDTTRYTTNRQYFDEQGTTTSDYYSTTTTENPTTTYESTVQPTEQTTISRAVPNDHWSTSPEVTKLWESTLYVDPLIINRNLGDTTDNNNDNEPTTYRPEFSTLPFKNLPTTITSAIDYDDEIDLKFTSTTTEESNEYASSTLPSTTTTDINEFYSTVIDLGIYSLLNTSETEIAHSQAQQIFGNLNSTEQDLLIEKMKEAESNSTVRRLILLLVSTCDASLSNNKTVQETRNSILHALLNVPKNTNVNIPDSHELNTRSGKQLNINKDIIIETTTLIPETTTSQTEELSKKTFAIRSSIEVPNKVVEVKNVHQDTRALELLRSLYSLAAKWGKK